MFSMKDGAYFKTDKFKPKDITSFVERYGLLIGEIVETKGKKEEVGVLIDVISREDKEHMKQYIGSTDIKEIKKYLDRQPETGFSSNKVQLKPLRVLKVYTKLVKGTTIVGFDNEENNNQMIPEEEYDRIVREIIKKFNLIKADIDAIE